MLLLNILVLKTRLDDTGFLGKLKSQIRAEIFRVLESEGASFEEKKQPTPTGETLLVHELLRETLEWFGYTNTLSVFLQESGHSAEKLEKKVLAAELNVTYAYNEQPDVALLLAVVAMLRTQKVRSVDQTPQQRNISSRLFHVSAEHDLEEKKDDIVIKKKQIFAQQQPSSGSITKNGPYTVYSSPSVQQSFSSDQGHQYEPLIFQK